MENFHTVLNQYRKESRFCDFEIRISSKIFTVHKVILAAASSYFEAMFHNQECFVENSNNFIELKDVDSRVFETILDYIYTTQIDIDVGNVEEIAQVASMLQLMDLMEMCSVFLRKNVQINNCVGILCFADSHGFHSLSFDAKRFIENNFAEIIKEDEFLELPHNIFRTFLKSESLSIDSEYQVLTCTIRWVLHDEQNRLQFLNEFINIIRMPVIPIEKIEAFRNCCSHKEVANAIDNYLKSQLESTEDDSEVMRNHGYDFIRQQPRMCARRSIYVIGGQYKVRNDDRATNKVERFDMHTHCWSEEECVSIPRSNHCAVRLADKLYVIGGKCESLILDTMEIYDCVTGKWKNGPSLNQPRTDFGACVFDSAIYVFGGAGPSGKSIERFDPKLNKWIYYGEMPVPRHSMHVVEHNGLIYIIGGIVADSVCSSVFVYNPRTRVFTTKAQLNTPRFKFGCAIMHNNIYVIGGTCTSGGYISTVEQYNPKEVRIDLELNSNYY